MLGAQCNVNLYHRVDFNYLGAASWGGAGRAGGGGGGDGGGGGGDGGGGCGGADGAARRVQIFEPHQLPPAADFHLRIAMGWRVTSGLEVAQQPGLPPS